MRFISALAALLLVSACATAAPSASSPASTSGRAPSALAGLLAAAGRPNAPSVAAIERAMGPADIRRQDGAGLALTYRMESCALLLLFSADAQNQMRLAVSHPSARRPSQAAPNLEQCADEAQSRRR